jgi:DNA polymerase-3 subunit alpha
MSSLAMTEHGNVMSHAKFEASVKEEKDPNGEINPAFGLKPIFGVELYTGATDEKNRTQMKNHLTVLAKDERGYQNMLQLVSKSYSEGFYYEPTVDLDMLTRLRSGLVVLSGCQGSELFTSLVGGKLVPDEDASYDRGKAVARRFKQAFDGSYFIEVQGFPELTKTKWANPLLARLARELKIPLVATMDCHYTLPTEKEIQKVLHAVRGMTSVEEKAREWGYAAELCPPLTDRALMNRLIATGLTKSEAIDAILNTELIAQDCNVELPKLDMVRYPLPKGYKTAHELVWAWIEEGWSYRGLNKLKAADRKAYKERVRYEMSIIEEKDFVDYFLIVSDAVRFAKDAGIGVGPARGSAAASLVCWLLRITEVNPMQFPHLVFERFIDITRQDLPDIDLDFESVRRIEVVDYLVSKYGRECVNNVGTFLTYKSKMALNDVARVHQIPGFQVDKIKDVLLERSSGDLRASASIEDTIDQFDQAKAVIDEFPKLRDATELEGNVKSFGVHAAGVVISNEPITKVQSILERTVKGNKVQVVAVDKYDAEYLGMLKLDILGLTAMDILVDMCKMLGHGPDFLYSIPLDDEPTIEGFKENDVVGIFQYEGRAMRMVNGAVKPDDFAEVCHITALARPGPLHNGAVADYVDIKQGNKAPGVSHPALEGITAHTQYQVVYQEQILQIVREIGDFDWTHAAYIRKIISRKLGDAEFNRQWQRFWSGCQKLHKDMSEETARAIWGLCTTAGSYAFNAAHSVSYGYIAWWTMWFKRNHPAIFFAASLPRADKGRDSSSSNAKASTGSKAKLDKHEIMLRDAVRHGFTILPPHLSRSELNWKREGRTRLRAGFDQIPGVAEKMGNKILEWRSSRESPPTSWTNLQEVSGVGPKTVEKMVEFCNSDDPFGVYRLDRLIEPVRKDLPRLGLPSPTHQAIDVPYERGDDLEVVWIGVAVHRNLRDIFEQNRSRTGEALDPKDVKDPSKNEFMLLAGYDGTDLLSLRITRWKYPKMKKLLWNLKLNEDVLVVQGVKPGWRTAREIYINKIWVLGP